MRFYSLTNPPPLDLDNEDYTGIPSLADPSQDEPIGVIVRKLLSGTLKVPPSDIEFDTDDITKVKDIDDFMTSHETLRPGYVDIADAQVYAELGKETLARLKRVSKENKESQDTEPLKTKKVESEEALSRSNEDLNGNKD